MGDDRRIEHTEWQLRWDVIVRLLEDEEKVMESWLYKQGEEKGIEAGVRRTLADGLRSVFVRRAGRQPTAEEEQNLTRRARDVSPEQLIDLATLPPDAFFGWLASA